MKNYDTRLKRLEERLRPGFLPVVIVDENNPLPAGVGPSTVRIIDDVPRPAIELRSDDAKH